jgi:hypothetical protein
MLVRYIGTFLLTAPNANHMITPMITPKRPLDAAPVAIQSHPPAHIVVVDGTVLLKMKEGLDVGPVEEEPNALEDPRASVEEVIATESAVAVPVAIGGGPAETVFMVLVSGTMMLTVDAAAAVGMVLAGVAVAVARPRPVKMV